MISPLKKRCASLLWVILILFTSCGDSDSIIPEKSAQLDLENVFNNNIVSISEDGVYERLRAENMDNYIIDALGILDDTDLKFKNFQIQEENDSVGNTPFYVLKATSENNLIKVAFELAIDENDGYFVIQLGLGCSCKSSSCSGWSGCEPRPMNGNCQCTSCSANDCEKTSTATFI